MSPSKAIKICSKQGCFIFIKGSESHCKEHKPIPFAKPEGYKRDPFYDSPAWRKTSKKHLSLNPLCVSCVKKGKVTAAVHTDHIIPIEKGGSRLDPENLQGLCLKHHSSKSAKERK